MKPNDANGEKPLAERPFRVFVGLTSLSRVVRAMSIRARREKCGFLAAKSPPGLLPGGLGEIWVRGQDLNL